MDHFTDNTFRTAFYPLTPGIFGRSKQIADCGNNPSA